MHGRGGVCGQEWGIHGRGCVWRGACMVKGDVYYRGGMARRGHAWDGGMCGQGDVVTGGHAWSGGSVCDEDTAGQCVGGTHPTGMHSCVLFIWSCMPCVSKTGWSSSLACFITHFTRLQVLFFTRCKRDSVYFMLVVECLCLYTVTLKRVILLIKSGHFYRHSL